MSRASQQIIHEKCCLCVREVDEKVENVFDRLAPVFFSTL